LEHDTGPEHPERPARLRAIVEKLRATHLWGEVEHLAFEAAELKWIEKVHRASYVKRVMAACESGERFLDSRDTPICPGSGEIAQLAVGGVLAAVDAVMGGKVDNAFCAVRPPGHHAEADLAMGFCLFNNVAIAAEYLIEKHGLKRVAIIDWDVHHGNGTQHVFEERDDVLFVSLHEHPTHLFPGTGFSYERGKGAGEGFTLNIPMQPGDGDEAFRYAMVFKVMPALARFRPEFLLVSAGFDAARHDPLAHLTVSADGFLWMTRHLKAEAEKMCSGRMVSVLEGGYDLRNLAECVALHVGALLEPEDHDGMMAVKAGI
jgi:acetoin utilization deacetylase AcuC-like enzyme